MSKNPNVEAIYPLSPTQQGLLFHSLYAAGSGVYTVQVAFTLTGPLDAARLAQAWQALVDRHPVLRTAFPWDRGSKPVQVVLREVAVPWQERDLRPLPTDERRPAADALRRAEGEQGFDLARAPLLRLVLVRLDEDLHELVWSYHHLLFDGWSLPILLRELVTSHAALCRGAAVELPPIRPYGGYIAWLQKQDAAAAESFWRRELAGFTAPTPLPFSPPAAAGGGAYGERVAELPAAATAALQAWARRRRLTLNTVVQGAWALLLSAVSGEDDVVFGVTTAGRPAELPGVESMVGLFINTLPARMQVPLDAPLEGWLRDLQARQLDVRRHEHSALPQVQQWSEVARGTPLFESLFVFENFPADDALRTWGGGVELRDLSIRDSSNYPVTVAVGVAPALVLRILWDTARGGSEGAERMLGHLRCLLEGMAAAPERRLEAFSLLTAAEEQQLVRELNDAAAAFPRQALAGLFAEQARARPNDPAVHFGTESLTYGELDRRANRLAHHLIALGVRAGDLVAVCLERSAALVTALLGIVKAGAAYVPLDPEHPVERLALMLAETRAAALVTRGDLRALLAAPGLATVLLDDPADPVGRQRSDDPARCVPAAAPAYVMYTSGSTGRPKGIVIPQEAVVRLVLGSDYVRLTPADRVAQASNASFDAATFEIWGALLNGALLVGVSRDTALSPRRLAAAIAEHGLTTLFLTTALFNQVALEVPDGFRPLTHLLFGGQAVDPGRVRDVLAAGPPARLLHVYGPTESTTFASWYRIEAVAPEDATVPIGGPLANTGLLVLDRGGRPAPLGAPGELYVGGEGLAAGYLGRPDLTAERFVPHPWRAGERLYRTGDLVRRDARGGVVFLGRVDHQVKIRGFRVEPAEVEVALGRHPAVREVSVIAREDGPGEKRLVAYVVPAAGTSPGVAELRAFLQERLPDFLIPSAFVFLAALPLNANGKVDRKALPAPERSRPAGEEDYVAPRTAAEELLAGIWAGVLGAERVGVTDDFFELGGDSILSIQVVARAGRAGLRISPRDVFNHPTVEKLAATAAAVVEAAEEAPAAPGPVPLTPIQHWFFAAAPAAPHHFNQAVLLAPRRPLDPGRLQAALDLLLAHHDALRLRFHRREDGWEQVQTAPGGAVPLDRVDLAAAEGVQAGLDLETGPLLRAALLRLDAGEERLLLVCHHLVVDGVSWRILLEDLETAYRRLERGEAPGLPARTTSYRRWAERLVEHAASPGVERELAWWLADGAAPPLPVDLPGRAEENTVAASRLHSVELDAETTRALLQEAPRAYHARIDDFLLAALLRTFGRWTGVDVLRLDLEGHGREDVLEGVDLSRTVGWFTTVYPVLLSGAGADGPGALLQAVKEQLRRIPHRGIGFGLLRFLGAGPARQALAALPAPEVGFNYLGQFRDAAPEEALFRLAQEPAGPLYSPLQRRRHLLEIDGVVVDGCLRLDWRWCEAFHHRTTVEALAAGMLDELRALVAHCLAPEAGGWTPSDFPLARIGRKPLDALVAAAGGPGAVEDVFPLTPAQQGMFFHSLYAPGSGVYVVQLSCLLRGALDAAALEEAWRRVAARHGILRSAVFWEGVEEPLQVIHRHAEPPFEVRDGRAASPPEQEALLAGLLADERRRGFDLGRAPLQRLTLLRLADGLHRLVWTHHHLLLDGWSLALVLKEVFTLYEALRQGREAPREPVAPFRSYVAWLQEQDLAAAEAFWRRGLSGLSASPALGFGRAAAPAREDGGTGERLQALTAELAAALGTLARRRGWTLSTLAHGAWAILAGRYGGEEDVVFGTVVSGRPAGLPGVETMIGPFVNTLPARVRVAPGAGLAAWLDELQAGLLELRRFEHTPLARIQEWSGTSKDQPLFESLLAFESYPMEEARAAAGLEILEVRSLESNNYPLSLAVAPGAQPLLRCLYDRGRFDDTAVERLLGHWSHLLEGIAAGADRRLGDLGLLAAAEAHQVLTAWNPPRAEAAGDPSLVDLFARQVARDAAAVAAVWDGVSLSYGELNGRANRLARHLLALGVAPGDFVALFLERSAELLVAILGILKAGAAYIPLDLDYPPERLAFMLEDTAAPVVLTREGLLPALPGGVAVPVLLDADRAAIDRRSGADLPPSSTGASLAYVMYTSGSTGRPKGIAIPQRAVRSLVCDTDYVRLGPDDRLAQVSNVSFDAATFEIWGALLNGGRVVGIAKDVALAPRELAAQIRARGITALFLTTALFNQVAREEPEGFRPLRTLLFGGQAVDPGRVREVLAAGPPGRLLHVYGPTETTTFASWYRIADVEAEAATVPIGHPLADVALYVVDRTGQPAPVGITGELWIGGNGLALGYHRRPEATAERFVPHPWSGRPGERLYRTGDLVRRLEDGAIEFVGRVDHQVKIRGFRIEPAEVEIALAAHPDLRAVSVVARQDEPGETRLVAYVVGGEAPPSTAVLRDFLRERVPEFMIPAAFVALDALPLDPNGKVDRRALPAPATTREADRSAVAPRTPLEAEIAGLWQELLGVCSVGVEDDFFALGGHSLLVTRLASRLREVCGVDLPLRTLFEAPTVAALSRVVAESRGAEAAGPAIPRVARDGHLPLSSAQQRLWFLHQLDPDSPAYNIAGALRIRGALPAAVLESALAAVVERHEALRTTFGAAEGQPCQIVHADRPAAFEVVDLRGAGAAVKEARLREIGLAEPGTVFDLERGPLVRAVLVLLGEDEQILFLTLHHIVSDGWSMGILSRELMEAGHAVADGRPPAFSPLPIQYVDFTAWHRGWLAGGVAAEQTAWWCAQLAGLEPLELPADRPRPAVRSLRGGQRHLWLPAPLGDEVKGFYRREGVTLFMVLLAAFQALLHRYTGRASVHVGSPVANRNRPEVEGLIGFFVNTLVLRTDLSGDPSFAALLRRVQEVALGAFAHQDLPFDALVDALQPERRLSQNPLVQVMLSVYEDPMLVARLPRSVVTPLEVHNGTAKFDLLWEAVDTADGLRLSAEHSADLFDPATIDRMLGHFRILLAAAVAAPERRLGELPLLTAHEETQLLGVWNDTRSDFPRETSLAGLFAARAAERPGAVAVRYGDRVLTYGELDREANRLAWHLLGLGVQPGEPVGLFLERSVELIVAVVAVLKAGGAYLPLDPDYPQERLAFLLEDGGVALLVTREGLQASLPAHAARTVCVDRDREALETARATAPPVRAWGGSPAYVMYTSGSTGRPKGIVIPQRAVSRLVLATDYVRLDATDRLGQVSNVSFDASTFEIWGALLQGGEIVGLSREVALSPAALEAEIRGRGVTATFLTTALFNQVARERPDAFRTMRHLLVGGQALEPNRIREVLAAAPPAALLNGYGPTECTTFALTHRITAVAPDATGIPIGRPIANTEAHVLDCSFQIVPVGIPGELCLGGDGLASGYLRHPALTADRFIPHPWSRTSAGGERLYRTGDLVRRLADGLVEYLGRLDDQVKIRGFRVEPGEIEAVLARHPGVAHVAVAPRETSPGELRLVAWVVGREGAVPTAAELRDFLQQGLPDFMIPSIFVPVEALPLSANGKVDKRALPAPGTGGAAAGPAGVAPRTEAEALLAGIWAQVLGREQVGVADNFFELGGDSILSIQIVARANQAGLALTPKQMFQHQTVAELAAAAGTVSAPAAEQGVLSGPVPLTPIQHWFFAQDLPEPHHFNQATLLELRRPLPPHLLAAALDALLLHHDALRLRFTRDESGAWHQRYGAAETAAFSRIDLAGLPAARRRPALEAATARLQAALDLAAGPLLRAALFHLGGDDPGRLFLAVHHLAIDGVSWRILMEDLLRTCERLGRGEPAALPAKTTSFRRRAERLAERARSPVVRRELPFWLAPAAAQGRPLPVDFPPSAAANQGASEATVTVELDAGETRALLQEVPRAFRARIDVALLAALLQTLAPWCGGSSLLVDLEGHGRDELPGEEDLSRTVGWFTSAWPVHLELPATADPGEILVAVKERLRAVPGGGLGFGLLRHLGEEADREALGRLPAAEVSFNYLGQFNEGLGEGAAFALAAESPGPARSPRGSRGHLLSVNGAIAEGRLRLHWLYSSTVHRRATVERLAAEALTALRALLAHCRTVAAVVLSPSDFPLAGLDAAGLRRVLATAGGVEDVYPPSPLQELMLLHAFSAAGSEVLVEHFCCRLHGPLEPAAFRAAWDRLVERHAVLRTAFLWEGLSRPLQVVRPAVEVPWQELDWTHLAAAEQGERLTALLRDDRTRGLDPTAAPVLRLTLVRLAPETHQLLWTYHHLLIDGWCLSTLLRELFALYEAARRGETAELARPRPYRDYLEWIQESDPEEAAAFWRAELAGMAPPRPLGTRRPIPGAGAADGGRAVEVRLPAEATAALNDAARRHRLTLSALVHGAWGLVLAAAQDRRDVVCGTTVSGRPTGLRGVESMVGLFINNLPLRLQLDDAEPALAWLRRLQETQVAMGDAGHLSPLQVQEWSGLPSGVRLFDSLVVFENYPVDESVLDAGGGLRLGDVLPGIRTTYPLTLVAAPGPRLLLQLVYDTRLFAGPEVERALHLLADLLNDLGATPERPLGDLLGALARSGVELATADVAAELRGAGRDGHPLVAPRDPLELQLAQILEEILGVRPVGVTDNFFELGGTSFLAVRLVSRLTEQLGRTLPLSVLFREPTVERLAVLLRQDGAPPAAGPLVPIQASGSRPPLFLVHPAGGTVLCYSDLARALPDQPIWGLEAAGLYDGEPLDRIEEMASRFVAALRTVQPAGPYRLGGWSFGGFVAFEMARQLTAGGDEVGLLALLDTWGPLKSRLRKALFSARLWVAAQRGEDGLGGQDDAAMLALFTDTHARFHGRESALRAEDVRAQPPEERVRFVLDWMKEARLLAPDSGEEVMRRFINVYLASSTALKHYKPGVYDGRITLFRAADLSAQHAYLRQHPAFGDPALGWGAFSTLPVEVHEVPGDHITMGIPPNVPFLAERLAACLG